MKCITFLVLIVICQYSDAQPTREYLPRPQLDGRIVGGNPIDIREAPHQVSLQRGSHFCGGSLIGSEWVLTAAHCTDGQNPAFLKVRIGSSTHQNDGILIDVKEIVQHQNFSYQNIDWDYSLIRLNESVDFDESKTAILLPETNEVIEDKASCAVTGWGNTQNATESRNVLRKADVPIVNQVKCSQAYKNYGGVTARMLCAGLEEGGKDACQGDSGGPLVCKGKIFGIVSWGYGCAQPKYPGIYSRVPVVREWIRENTGL